MKEFGFRKKIPADENGYPLEVPFNVEGMSKPQDVHLYLPKYYPTGRYVVLWDGDGELDFW